MFSPVEKFDLICYVPVEFSVFWVFWDWSLTNMSVYLFFTVFTCIVFFVFALVNKMQPSFMQISIEKLLVFIFDMVDKQMGVKGYMFFPFFSVLFCFILFCNLYGLAPFSFAPTAHIVLTFFLSSLVWFSAMFLGMVENGVGFYKLFVPNVPPFLLPFLVLVEIFSYLISVFSLAIRLAANITAGHVLLFTMAGFSVKLVEFNWFVFGISLVMLSLIIILEFGVALLQAYVFVVLSCIYFNDSLNLSH